MTPHNDDLDHAPTLLGLHAGATVFDRYKLERPLGRGGMGVVWLVQDQRLQRQMALKFLPETLQHDPVALDDLRRETRRCLELTHPNIVRIYDLVEDEAGRRGAIAMEYVDGKTLSQLRLKQENRVFEPAKLNPWLEEVAEALTHAHDRGGMVHRDLKPSNIMVNSRGEVKVADFGIASRISDSLSRLSRATQQQSGTLVYMSPQQFSGAKAAVTDDVYSLGATLYELLTSRPPFFSGSIEHQLLHIAPPSIAERRAELEISNAGPIPDAWEKAIARALGKDPAARPQSVREFVALLRDQPAGRRSDVAASPVGRRPANKPASEAVPPPSEDVPARAAQRKGPWVAAVALILGAGAVGAGWKWLNRDPKPQSDPVTNGSAPEAGRPRSANPPAAEAASPPAPPPAVPMDRLAVTAGLEPTVITVGETAVLTVNVTGRADTVPSVTPPVAAGLTIEPGPAESQAPATGDNQNLRVRFTVKAAQAGSFAIPPVEADGGTARAASNPLTLTVKPAPVTMTASGKTFSGDFADTEWNVLDADGTAHVFLFKPGGGLHWHAYGETRVLQTNGRWSASGSRVILEFGLDAEDTNNDGKADKISPGENTVKREASVQGNRLKGTDWEAALK